MILHGFFLLAAAYLIIWGRIPTAGFTSATVAGHPILVRAAGVGLVILMWFARSNGNPTFLLISGVFLFLLLAVGLFLGN